MRIDININTLIEDGLIKDLNKFARNVTKYSAESVKDELNYAAYYAISGFYNDVTPKVYQRTYGVAQGFYDPFVHEYGKVYRGGIRYTPEKVGVHYKWKSEEVDPPEEVFGRVIEGGYHGPGKVITDPTPKEYINEAYEKILNNLETYVEKGVSKASSDSYTYISF